MVGAGGGGGAVGGGGGGAVGAGGGGGAGGAGVGTGVGTGVGSAVGEAWGVRVGVGSADGVRDGRGVGEAVATSVGSAASVPADREPAWVGFSIGRAAMSATATTRTAPPMSSWARDSLTTFLPSRGRPAGGRTVWDRRAIVQWPHGRLSRRRGGESRRGSRHRQRI